MTENPCGFENTGPTIAEFYVDFKFVDAGFQKYP
jgi:hypothetical protein